MSTRRSLRPRKTPAEDAPPTENKNKATTRNNSSSGKSKAEIGPRSQAKVTSATSAASAKSRSTAEVAANSKPSKENVTAAAAEQPALRDEALEEIEDVEEEADAEVAKIMADEAHGAGLPEEADPSVSQVHKSSSPEIVSISSSDPSQGKKDDGELVELSDDEVEELRKDEEEEDKDQAGKAVKAEAKVEVKDEVEEEPEPADENGDPSREPGVDAKRFIDPDHLTPFRHGWKREVVTMDMAGTASLIDILYIPPPNAYQRTREAKRKRVSKADQERYFEDFPSKTLSVINFNYVRRALGVNNAAYEIIRERSKDDPPSTALQQRQKEARAARAAKAAEARGRNKKVVNYKEVEEHVGLTEVYDSDDSEEKINYVRGLNVDLPVCLQIERNVTGLRAEHKKRRRRRDPATCSTPPLAEDLPWAEITEDPVGVYNDLGGRSSPSTPPPLRAVKLTPAETAVRIGQKQEEVRACAAKMKVTMEPDVKNNMASHDAAIKRFQHYVEPGKASAWPKANDLIRALPGLMQNRRVGNFLQPSQFLRSPNGAMSMLGNNSHYRRQNPLLNSIQWNRSNAASGNPMAHMDGISGGYGGPNSNVKVKLPMKSVNGKRPVVQLVMWQEGKYQPVNFTNNMQVTESIPRRTFEQANSLRRTMYLKATQVPRIGKHELYLAINPAPLGAEGLNAPGPPARNNGALPLPKGMPARQSAPAQQARLRSASNANVQRQNLPQQRPQPIQPRPLPQQATPEVSNPGPSKGDQVAILVKRQGDLAGKYVLLNVPLTVAQKVKPGTTLSFFDVQHAQVRGRGCHPARSRGV